MAYFSSLMDKEWAFFSVPNHAQKAHLMKSLVDLKKIDLINGIIFDKDSEDEYKPAMDCFRGCRTSWHSNLQRSTGNWEIIFSDGSETLL
jgi:hypothetical protein